MSPCGHLPSVEVAAVFFAGRALRADTVTLPRSTRRRLGRRTVAGALVATAAVVVTAVIIVFVTGDFVPESEEIEEFFTDSGALGPIVFVLAMWILQPLGVPGVMFMVPAAVVWPLPVAMVLSWIGNMGASTIAFVVTRWVARAWAQAHLPDRLRVWDQRLSAGGYNEVIVLRLITGQFPPADWVLGISNIGFRQFLVGTGIGIIPGIVLITVAGGGLVPWIFAEPVRVVVASAVTALAVAALWWRRRSGQVPAHRTEASFGGHERAFDLVEPTDEGIVGIDRPPLGDIGDPPRQL